jgi:hypothetical protein
LTRRSRLRVANAAEPEAALPSIGSFRPALKPMTPGMVLCRKPVPVAKLVVEGEHGVAPLA